jgi:hypothetical protein
MHSVIVVAYASAASIPSNALQTTTRLSSPMYHRFLDRE